MDGISLIDVSSEDDLLIAASDGDATAPEAPLDPHSSEKYHENNRINLETVHEELPMKMSNQMEQVTELSESPEGKPKKSGKFNLRKSLAWDNAFLTSEGVLNAEELSIISSTCRKTEACSLPGIQELRKSVESTSTLDSDSWALENLEVDLFDNFRASIQKSLGKSDKGVLNSNRTTEQRELNASRLQSSKKIELSSQTKMKPHNALGRHGVLNQQPTGTSKVSIIRTKVDARENGDLKPSSKPPRVAPRGAPLPSVPTKKTYASGVIQTKSSSGNSGNRQSLVAIKRSADSGAISDKSSIPSSKDTSDSNSYETSFVSSSSDSSGISPLENSRKRVARYSDHPSSGSGPKALLRVTKSKTTLKNTNIPPIHLKSFSKLSSNVSPNSSIDSLASESSSVSFVAPKCSNSTDSLDAGSSSIPTLPFSTDQPCSRTGNSKILSQSQLVSGNLTRSSTASGAGANSLRPSGLRMPTPKVGYFDPEKSLIHSSSKFSQPSIQNNLSRKTTGISSSAVGVNKLKTSKLPSVRPSIRNTSVNSDSPFKQTKNPLPNPVPKPASPSALRRLSKPSGARATVRVMENRDISSKVSRDSSPMSSEDGRVKVFEAAGASETTKCLQMSNLNAEEQVIHLSPKHAADSLDGENSEFHGNQDALSCISSIKESRTENRSDRREKIPHADNNGENLNAAMVELMGQKIASLRLAETKDLTAAGDPFSVQPTSEELGLNGRTPLAENMASNNSPK